jgi:leucyl/phenylalanyl-tRNA--protein transferase
VIPWLGRDIAFPPLATALREPNGLLAAGGDLSPRRLLEAYRRGIFPWFSEGDPILWWSPDPRMVLAPAELKVSRSLAKTLRNKPYEVRFDTAFDAVIRACAAPREGEPGTWITAEMRAAYDRLHRLGYAHSVETWIDGELAGGLYGVAIGRMFYGESMFSRARDASKIALAHLARRLQEAGFGLIDCQMRTEHLASLGAREIPRAAFQRAVGELVDYPGRPGPWTDWGTAAEKTHEPCRN